MTPTDTNGRADSAPAKCWIRTYVAVFALFFVCQAVLAQEPPAASDPGPPVNAGTDSGRQLHAPVPHDEFSFVIFGDRTGGPASGVKILDEAVTLTNHLSPTFVMTVGDLIQGYNRAPQWKLQAQEYHDIMSRLRMPWYPVAGNHDVYSRPHTDAGHLNLYKEKFGPLYYSFDYRWAHFVILFSDEKLAFHNPAVNQNMSQKQMDWLRRDLAQTKAEQIYVFLHHPRWNYAGTNWPDVHRILAKDGRVEGVFAGHLHTYRNDGRRDDIQYYVLAATGAYLGRYKSSASIHHINHLRVRRDGFTMCVIPMSKVYGDDYVLGSELDEMHLVLGSDFLKVRGRAEVALDEARDLKLKVSVVNPSERRMHYQIGLDLPESWQLRERVVNSYGELDPGKKITTEVAILTAPITEDVLPEPKVTATLTYRLGSGVEQPLSTEVKIPLRIDGIGKVAAARPEADQALVLNGESALRVDLTDSVASLEQVTVECWVKGAAPASRCGLIAKTQGSSFGIFWCDPNTHPLPTGHVHLRGDGYQSVGTKQPWQWDEWHHLALSFDGKVTRFFLNGKLQEESTKSGSISTNRHPFFVGADPNGSGKPMSFFRGSIDEVRVSKIARYRKDFTPAQVHRRDKHTVLLFHFDDSRAGVMADDSGHENHGWPVGKPQLEPSERMRESDRRQ